MSKVAVVMGSTSDMPVMQDAIDILKVFDIEVDVDIVSAHRTPEKLFDFSKNAHTNGYTVIIAGAGGAATIASKVTGQTSVAAHRMMQNFDIAQRIRSGRALRIADHGCTKALLHKRSLGACAR